MKGVTPVIRPAQNAASPGSDSPSSDRKSGRNDMTPTMEMPAPTWMAQTRYTMDFQLFKGIPLF